MEAKLGQFFDNLFDFEESFCMGKDPEFPAILKLGVRLGKSIADV